jgi:hypothetical protein
LIVNRGIATLFVHPVRNNAPLLYGGVRFYNSSGGI